MDERIAIERIRRIDRRVRGESAWYGVFCLIVALTAGAYVVVSHLLGAGHVAVLWLIFGALLALGVLYWAFGRQQQAVSLMQARMDVPMALGTMLLMGIALALRHALVPEGFNWSIVMVALLPALPCLIGAWKVLRP